MSGASRVLIQEKVATQTALGQTMVWKPVAQYYCRKVPLSVSAVARYQQLNTEVTDRFIFKGSPDIDLGVHRLVFGGRIYQPMTSIKVNGKGDSEVACNDIGAI